MGAALAAEVGIVAGALGLVQGVPYLRSILRGQTKPSRSANVIWSLVNCVALVSYVAAGARATIWFGAATTVTGLSILALSTKYGMGGRSRLDCACLVGAASAILLWVTSGDPAAAVVLCAASNALGYLPVLRKAYSAPATENTTSWAICSGAAFLNLLAIRSLTLHIVLPPLVSAAGAGTTAALLLRARRQPGKRPRKSFNVLAAKAAETKANDGLTGAQASAAHG
jgi:hypothetical protein